MICDPCKRNEPHVHVEDCAECGKHERVYFDGLCAVCHERAQFRVPRNLR